SIDAENNWWGTNSDPSSLMTGPGSVNASPWLKLSINANPSFVGLNGSSAITADLAHNSANQDLSGNPDAGDFDGFAVGFTSSLGSLNHSSDTLSGAEAGAVVSYGTTGGQDTVTATLDGVDASTIVAVGILSVTSDPVNVPLVPIGEAQVDVNQGAVRLSQ